VSTAAIELPLFPLNVVLFPGAVLPLHIFEPRYRQMIIDCQREGKPFGVVLAKPESEYLNEVPHPIGTMAEISNLDQLEDGGYVLVAVGTKRFRILSQHRDKPYLSGMVALYEDEMEMQNMLSAQQQQTRHLFGDYLRLLAQDVDEQDLEATIPDEAEELSLFVASFLDVQDEQKQQFLEMTSTQQRLQEELAILRREVPFIRQMLGRQLSDERAKLN
jgi:Lon protease-like protein